MISLSIVLLVWIFYVKLYLKEAIAGWASILIPMLILGGVQLFCLGIIAEYIARLFDEAKGRPIYIIKEKININ